MCAEGGGGGGASNKNQRTFVVFQRVEGGLLLCSQNQTSL